MNIDALLTTLEDGEEVRFFKPERRWGIAVQISVRKSIKGTEYIACMNQLISAREMQWNISDSVLYHHLNNLLKMVRAKATLEGSKSCQPTIVKSADVDVTKES